MKQNAENQPTDRNNLNALCTIFVYFLRNDFAFFFFLISFLSRSFRFFFVLFVFYYYLITYYVGEVTLI